MSRNTFSNTNIFSNVGKKFLPESSSKQVYVKFIYQKISNFLKVSPSASETPMKSRKILVAWCFYCFGDYQSLNYICIETMRLLKLLVDFEMQSL